TVALQETHEFSVRGRSSYPVNRDARSTATHNGTEKVAMVASIRHGMRQSTSEPNACGHTSRPSFWVRPRSVESESLHYTNNGSPPRKYRCDKVLHNDWNRGAIGFGSNTPARTVSRSSKGLPARRSTVGVR